jgi:predicted component of type VI protein secretion system
MDIIEKLRHPNRCQGDEYQSLGNLCHDAAHEIERLRAALTDARQAINDYGLDDFDETTHQAIAKIDEALNQQRTDTK